MAKMRHISYRAEDVDAMAKFFVAAFGLTMVQKRQDGAVDLSDGSVKYLDFPTGGKPKTQSGARSYWFFRRG